MLVGLLAGAVVRFASFRVGVPTECREEPFFSGLVGLLGCRVPGLAKWMHHDSDPMKEGSGGIPHP